MERRQLGEILVEQGLITEDQLNEGLHRQVETGAALGKALEDLEYVTEQQVLHALSLQAGMEMVDLESIEIPDEVIALVPYSTAEVYRIVPISFDGESIVVAMADPQNVRALDDIRFLLGYNVKGAVSNEEDISKALEKYYAGESESIEDLLGDMDMDEGFVELDDTESIDISDLEQQAYLMPVVKLVNLVLLTAIKDQASDIHFEPFESEYKIRYRVDGVLYEITPPPKHLSLAIASRIKVMSRLNISERRLPQDGRIDLNIGGRAVELRVSTLPTINGESVVIRVLDRSVIQLDMEQIGMNDDEINNFRDLINMPHGIILVTGPTGSGKTTTLYAALNEANTDDIKILTTEDPVEYEIDGIVQISINEAIGLTYAKCLRAILRQDPDKLLVGEIRDLQTATIAIEASLTGHIVFSTLHTNDAPSAITRMIDQGSESFLVAATLEAIIAQRLVRRICTNCKIQYDATDENLMELGLRREDVGDVKFSTGKGCDFCHNSGYKGRTGIFEFMRINDQIREKIIAEASIDETRRAAEKSGMRNLRESGIAKVFEGVTTIEEIVNITVGDSV